MKNPTVSAVKVGDEFQLLDENGVRYNSVNTYTDREAAEFAAQEWNDYFDYQAG